MVIYEVTLEIDPDIEPAYAPWLAEHAREMTHFEGFESARIFRRTDDDSDRITFVVHYVIRSHSHLEVYLREHADRMRADGARRFGERFRASRRILDLQRQIGHEG